MEGAEIIFFLKKKSETHHDNKRKLHPPATPLFKTKRFVQIWRSGDPHRKLVMISNPPPITDWSVMTLKPLWLRHRPDATIGVRYGEQK